MTKYIIVKYAKERFPDGKAHIMHSVFGTYSANQADIEVETYNSPDEAKDDLKRYRDFNPSVCAGIVEMFHSDDMCINSTLDRDYE